ncbi:PTS system mannose/fructose/N-acetylgalactosamine-transporter subunit IIB [Pediococcus cellicola]|uniref:Phosphoenolpyruvate-dependent sugar phosphotransferase system eiiab, probable mannose specific n=2 Tax=Pediococcus cellicola TaxID=319652 RepID=A0A0R2IU49_9LACO|nr:PTS sugar transporter subunit IIB [Pediococcus cellicola]KRN65037.1 phosphoenolpyruvate-dependent sugar phosphotransferase system eiiab, probable mannose specific [Pediococcus cellicola]
MMSIADKGIKNIRIDERLIHGQVATMWTNSLQASRIMVVDDDVVNNKIEKMALKTAVPMGIKLSILTAKGAAKRILEDRYIGQKVFLLVKKPQTLVELIDYDLPINKIVVGNMSSREGRRSVKKSVAVSQDDVEAFNYLKTAGVQIVAQMVPSEPEVDFMNLLK